MKKNTKIHLREELTPLDPRLIQWASGFCFLVSRCTKSEAKAFSDLHISMAAKIWSQDDIDRAISEV